MKGHKAHHHKAEGGFMKGKEIKEDEKEHEFNKDSPVNEEGEGEEPNEADRKHGGRTKKKSGGGLKHFGHVEGEAAKHRMDRKPRKSGGRLSEKHIMSPASKPVGH
jgi:hypothetical protein